MHDRIDSNREHSLVRAGAEPAGAVRFNDYLAAVAENGFKRRTPYPELVARPWPDPTQFPVVRALEGEFEAIRRELADVAQRSFQSEGEQIHRAGDWDVLLLYERGRKVDTNCRQCPKATQIIEAHNTVRTLAGLIYFSRLRPGTHIASHCGPTNLRVRCHLGIQIPPGDCAIRVNGETRGWQQGRCLVFDDSLPHEAWNNTPEPRVVLIVDLWHPDLTPEEVILLRGMHHFAFVQADSLYRYWLKNSRARTGRVVDYD